MLESYRVVLLQRQPAFYPASNILEDPLSPFASTVETAGDKERTSGPSALLRCLLSPHLSHPGSTNTLEWLFCLTSLTVLSWHTKPHRLLALPLPALLNKDLVELALYRWHDMITKCLPEVETWMMILYHNILVDLNTPVKHIHNLARTHVAGAAHSQDSQHILQAWQRGEDCPKALWHANAILQLAKSKTVLSSDHGQKEAVLPSRKQMGLSEAAHLPISVYVATLTIWAQSVCQEPPNYSATQSALESGIAILSCLTVRAAKQIVNVLREIAQRRDIVR